MRPSFSVLQIRPAGIPYMEKARSTLQAIYMPQRLKKQLTKFDITREILNLIFYDGIYRIKRQKKRKTSISGRYAPAWRIRLIDFTLALPEVRHLKPIAIVATSLSNECFKTNCAETIGKKICRDFNLKVSEVLWVENFDDDPSKVYIASLTPKARFGFELFYDVKWRPASPNEIQAVSHYIPEINP